MVNSIDPGHNSYSNINTLQSKNSTQKVTQDIPIEQFKSGAVGSNSDILQISQAAFDLHGNQLPGGTFADPYTFLSRFGEDIPDTNLEIQLSSEDQKFVDALNKELEKIFGVPDENLTGVERQKENELVNAIDKILQKTEPEPLTKAQERQFESISKEIEKLFEDGKLTANEEKKLTAFEARIEKIFENQEPIELSATDQKELETLFRALDNLYGIKQPSKEEIARSEEIFVELDKIYAKSTEQTSIHPISGENISKENFEKLEKLLTEIQKTLDRGTDLKLLSDKDHQEAEAIGKQIDELLGINELTDTQQENVNKISKQIEKLFEDGVLTADEESTLAQLDKQLETLFGKPEALSATDNKKLDELFAQLDKIYDKQVPLQIDSNKLTQLSQELEDLHMQIFQERKIAG